MTEPPITPAAAELGVAAGIATDPDSESASHSFADLSHEEVKSRATRGALNVMVRGLLVRAIGLGGNLVIARVLTPRDFGLVAIGNSVMVIGDFISSGGLSAALINRPGRVPRDDLRLMTGFAMSITAAAAALVLLAAIPFGIPLVLGSIMTCSLVIDTTRLANGIVLERQMDYGPLIRAEVAENIAWNAWAIATVLAGFGVWGIATAQVFRALVGTAAINYFGPERPVLPAFSWRRTRGMLGLGVRFQAVQLVQLIREQGITFVISIVGGLSVLGLWGILSRLVLIIGVLLESLWRVSFPAASRLLETGADPGPPIQRAIRIGTTLTGALAVPLLGTAPALVHVLFGPQWNGAVDAVPATCVGIIISAAPVSICFGYFMASGRGDYMLLMTILDGIVSWGVGLSLTPALGVEGLSFGGIAGALVQLRFVDYGMRRDLGVSVVGGIWMQTLAGLVAAVPAWIVAERLGADVVSVLASGTVAICGYALALALVRRQLIVEVFEVFHRTLRRRAAVA